MSDQSTIQWTDATWNPVRGCSVVSPGCHNCYAMRQAHRFDRPGGAYEGTTKAGPHGPLWTGNIILAEDKLMEPLRWKKPRRIFVNSMSDLFHKGVPDEYIDRVFAVMALCPQHTFQVLTKRPERALRWFAERTADPEPDRFDPWPRKEMVGMAAEKLIGEDAVWAANRQWPLPNVWLGVSAEDQQRADERIPLLLQTPAAVRFLSCEPLLGEINLHLGRSEGLPTSSEPCRERADLLHWCIVGGESGSGARQCNVDWIRSIVRQCQAAGVPCFVKQLGANVRGLTRSGLNHDRIAEILGSEYRLRDHKGGDPDE